MSGRVRTLGLAWTAWSAIVALIGAAAGLGAVGLAGLMHVVPDSRTGEPAPTWLALGFGGFGAFLGGLLVLYGLAGVAIGWSLRRGRTWAKWGALVLAITQISQFPIGTLLGVATFAVLFGRDPDAPPATGGGGTPEGGPAPS